MRIVHKMGVIFCNFANWNILIVLEVFVSNTAESYEITSDLMKAYPKKLGQRKWKLSKKHHGYYW